MSHIDLSGTDWSIIVIGYLATHAVYVPLGVHMYIRRSGQTNSPGIANRGANTVGFYTAASVAATAFAVLLAIPLSFDLALPFLPTWGALIGTAIVGAILGCGVLWLAIGAILRPDARSD